MDKTQVTIGMCVMSIHFECRVVSFLNSVSDLISKMWYRIPFDQSELSISKTRPTRRTSDRVAILE